jgi:hypothetical protein
MESYMKYSKHPLPKLKYRLIPWIDEYGRKNLTISKLQSCELVGTWCEGDSRKVAVPGSPCRVAKDETHISGLALSEP